ncbi:MAG: AAA family ATPase [Candidatus Marinimicrobia bacterium]|nr:AAA family ATPase [Candidatus Neomarinimicrobiota bacterium]
MDKQLAKLQNKDAEKNIIAELVSNNQALANIQNLKPHHFSSGKLKRIYKKILEIDAQGRPVDLVTLSNEIEGVNVSELSYLIGEGISSVKVKEYENIIISNWIRRKLLQAGYNFVSKISKPKNDPSDLVSMISEKFDNILKINGQTEKLGDIENTLSELVEQRVDGIKEAPGIKTSYAGIDKRTGGFQPGDLVTIGGSTSSGKTAFSLNICENLVFNSEPTPIGYITLELSKSGILDRLICTKAGINTSKFYNNEVTTQDKNKYQNIASDLYNKPFYIVDNISSLPDIKMRVNLLCKNYETRIIFVDNLQNILGNAGEDFRKLITQATKTLKALAKRLNITIVALSHLSRSGDESKCPRLSDLKESSSIEQDSDKVLLIHRPYKEAGLRDFKEDCSLSLAKNRQGQTGRIELIFNRKIARFENTGEEKDAGF